MEPLTITIGDIELEADPVNGELVDGELMVDSVNVTFTEEVYHEFTEPVVWDVGIVKEKIRSSWMEEGRWPDTLAEWEAGRLVNTDTQRWHVMQFIVSNSPVTSSDIEDYFNDEDSEDNISVNSAIHGLKNKNLVKAIGHQGRREVLAPTHLAFKELYSIHGMNLREYGIVGDGDDGGSMPTLEMEDEGKWAF